MTIERNSDVLLPVVQSPYGPSPGAGPACIHLLSKSLYVHGALRYPEVADDAGSQHCWCNITQHVLGPDESQVGPRECVAGRECYRDTH